MLPNDAQVNDMSVEEAEGRKDNEEQTTEIDITFTTDYGETAAWSDLGIIEFEIVDGMLRVYTDGEVSRHEIPLDRLEHLAVSTASGDGVHWSGYLERHINGGVYDAHAENDDA